SSGVPRARHARRQNSGRATAGARASQCRRTASSRMSIDISRVSKRFGSFVALDDVSFTVKQGELLALLGPSGSARTRLRRIIAGREEADTGSVLFDGDDATRRNPRDRGVGFVFQHYALFRHMTVFENVAFGLRVRPRAQRPAAGGDR